jgi:HEAT repeat protein
MDQSMAQEIVTGGLESEDEEIQAWATHQLRSQHVPEAIGLLVERLDSPLPAVRAAARDELQGFDISIMLDHFEKISPAVCLRAGQLIRKIDLDCIDKLRKELESSIRRRKIQAARASVALGMHVELVPALISLLADTDPLVRRTGISSLATIQTAETIEALSGMLHDENERVRDEAARVLTAWKSLVTSSKG